MLEMHCSLKSVSRDIKKGRGINGVEMMVMPFAKRQNIFKDHCRVTKPTVAVFISLNACQAKQKRADSTKKKKASFSGNSNK
ncbi:CLUMA_CG019721, isoform A [Clunio marinus]|uniref:CLUMA_CG019721, isoform A n=1 Tax=Clunio marinus TaxID=568069 RepID=A0A1J1J442_9DIPT|nr:CLUMA_CG019721, isoform A [Clunio marinus]